MTAAHLLVGVVGHRYPFADVYGPGRSGDREVMDLLPERSSTERGEDPSARGKTYAELYHPDHAEDRARWAAERRAAYDAAFSDPGPGPCGTCGEVRPLVWSWGICQPCYSASVFDPPYETFVDKAGEDEHPDDRAAAFAEDWQSARYGE
ncbi:hypothetical protein [Streptosporangium sp. NPDC023615]|uniref:hypothetical protein n=1 Tax=Streptosporangium sp. NPDC023615 TaxID=3154794 RepID=UPI00341F3250